MPCKCSQSKLQYWRTPTQTHGRSRATPTIQSQSFDRLADSLSTRLHCKTKSVALSIGRNFIVVVIYLCVGVVGVVANMCSATTPTINLLVSCARAFSALDLQLLRPLVDRRRAGCTILTSPLYDRAADTMIDSSSSASAADAFFTFSDTIDWLLAQ